jgi:hypothetical protein
MTILRLLKGEKASRLDQADKAEYERVLAVVLQQLDEAAFNAAWNEGRAMTLEQAIELAMKDE